MGEWTARDLRYDRYRKQSLDEKVEGDIIKRYETACDDAKKLRSSHISSSKKYSDDSIAYESFLQKAEAVDLSSCAQLKEYRKVVK